MKECDYCVDNTFSNQYIEKENLDIRLCPVRTGNRTKLAMVIDHYDYSGYSEETVDINYCPMCGRELKEVSP